MLAVVAAVVVLLTGDSIAVGTAPAMRGKVPTRVQATVGIGSRAGVARLRRDPAKTVAVSLGANDADDDPRFERRVELALEGRLCVAWALIPSRPRHNAALRRVARRDRRLELVAVHPGPDGVHPTPAGYRALADGFVRSLTRCAS